MGEALLSKETGLDEIHAVKDFGKSLARQRCSATSHRAGTVLYYGAIASALVHHGARITSYSYRALAKSFADLMDWRWLPPGMTSHFAKARDLCRARADR
jgi:hypothetical protein